MLKSGYYAAYKDLTLSQEQRRTKVRKRDWLVTDGKHVGRFDRTHSIDWVPLTWPNGQPVVLDEDLSRQLQNATVPTSFERLSKAFARQLDTGDGTPAPDMPRPSSAALGAYLRAHRELLATYRR